MLEKPFQARFFQQVTAMDVAGLTQKIEEIEQVSKKFEKGSEAFLDSKFLLKHLRRIRLEKATGQRPVVH